MTPLILDADLRGLDARVQLALHQDPADVLRALFRDLLPDEPGSAPTLQAEFDRLAPLEDADVTLHARTDQVTLVKRIGWPSSGTTRTASSRISCRSTRNGRP